MTQRLFSLDGKVALVTGGNSGIGLGFAQALADAGADVAIWGTSADKNAAALARLGATGRRFLVQPERANRDLAFRRAAIQPLAARAVARQLAESGGRQRHAALSVAHRRPSGDGR